MVEAQRQQWPRGSVNGKYAQGPGPGQLALMFLRLLKQDRDVEIVVSDLWLGTTEAERHSS